jgi:hypothetical protein
MLKLMRKGRTLGLMTMMMRRTFGLRGAENVCRHCVELGWFVVFVQLEELLVASLGPGGHAVVLGARGLERGGLLGDLLGDLVAHGGEAGAVKIGRSWSGVGKRELRYGCDRGTRGRQELLYHG